MTKTYGVFTIERDDLVEISRRIAQCIPEEFLKDKRRPVVIAVDGVVRSGKKIVADYGREALLNIDHDDLDFEYDLGANEGGVIARIKSFFSKDLDSGNVVKSNGKDVLCRGKVEFDEYVRAKMSPQDIIKGSNEKKCEVSFINTAWCGGYSFNDFSSSVHDSFLKHHMSLRAYGGVAYVHNEGSMQIEPDIRVNVVRGGGGLSVIGAGVGCPNVNRAIDLAAGRVQLSHKSDPHSEGDWRRYITVSFNNAALERAGAISNRLLAEFGFQEVEAIAPEVFAPSGDEVPVDAVDVSNIPIFKKHAALVQAGRHALQQDTQHEKNKLCEISIRSGVSCGLAIGFRK